MSTTTIAAMDGSGRFDAFVTMPSSGGPHGAVVLIQEIFGVNEVMRDTARQFADVGFLVVVPDLFWRIRPGVDLSDKTEVEWKEAFALMNAFDQDKGIEDLKATVAAAHAMPGCNGRVGTVGYCLGERLAMMALHSDADVNVSYYGVELDGTGSIRAPLPLHIAEHDEFFPEAGRAKLIGALRGNSHVQAHVYPGNGHAFARVGGVHWQGRAATIANGCSAEALVAALG